MKNCFRSSLSLVALFLVTSFPVMAQRSVINLDCDWNFHLGDVPSGQELHADISEWGNVDIPHDWSIEQKYAKDAPGGKSNAFLPGGIGWYRKKIVWDDSWQGKNVSILFEGIYSNSTVWINGHKLGFRPNGYLDLYYDLTPYLTKGENIIAVKADNSMESGARWYTGCGIYRYVYLIVTDEIRFRHNATFVHTPDISSQRAVVDVETEFENLSEAASDILWTASVEDSEGNEVASVSKKLALSPGRTDDKQVLSIKEPKLWQIDSPNVYYLKNTIKSASGTDSESVMFGVRTMEFIPNEGFKLNGEPMKFKGVCLHQDAGAVGTAVLPDIWHDRLKTLKKMGCNAIRTAHHPFSREFYTMCDTMGIMVMNELWDGWYQWPGANKAKYDNGSYFLEWWQQDLQEFIRRDRNHACIAMWCMGNEVWGYGNHQYLQKLINDTFHELDPSHPTTQAWALDYYLDIAGFNGNGEGRNDIFEFHKRHPDKLAVGTEIPHTRQTRGVYRTKGSFLSWDRNMRGETVLDEDLKNVYQPEDLSFSEVFNGTDMRYASGYDNQTRRISCRNQWKHTRDNDFFIGEFRWSGYDYLGESWGWPARTNNYGIIDMAGFPKDAYYLYQSFWTDKPMVHLLPHWTHPGKEGIRIPVVVYTNCDSAELFLNGKSLGRKNMDKDTLQIVWSVPYVPGNLKAVAYRSGKPVVEKLTETAGKPTGVKLSVDKSVILANRKDVVRVVADIVDAKGNLVPDADNQVRFSVTGPYKLLGVENGDILDVNSNKSYVSKAFKGKTLLLLQSTDTPGTVRITVESERLSRGNVRIESKSQLKF